jgi:hypothetical protein
MHFCPEVPQLLVGTKMDLRRDEGTLNKLRQQSQVTDNDEVERVGNLFDNLIVFFLCVCF